MPKLKPSKYVLEIENFKTEIGDESQKITIDLTSH